VKHQIQKTMFSVLGGLLTLGLSLQLQAQSSASQTTATSISGTATGISSAWWTAGSISGTAGSVSGTAGSMSSAGSVSGTSIWVDPVLHSYAVPKYRTPVQGDLSEALLNMHDFRLQGDQLMDTSTTPESVVGKIMVVDAKMVFEWADADYSEAWIWNGEISSAEMKDILAEPGQAAGKGFYVSLDPMDSSSYGPAMTVFHPKGGSITVLEFGWSERFYSDTAFVQRLSDAGIEGLRYQGYSQTWISTISSNVLKRATAMPKSVFMKIATNKEGLKYLVMNRARIPLDSYGQIELPQYLRQFFKGEALTPEEKLEAQAAGYYMP
jgi:hypothetical protein